MTNITPAALEHAELLKKAVEDALNRQSTPHLTAYSSSKREDENSTDWGALMSRDGDEIADLVDEHAAILNEGVWAVCARASRSTPTEKWHAEVLLFDHSVQEKLKAERAKLEKTVEQEFRRFAEGKAWSRVALSYDPAAGPAQLIVDTGGAAVEKYPPTEKLTETLQRAVSLYRDAGLQLRTAKWTLKKNFDFREYFS